MPKPSGAQFRASFLSLAQSIVNPKPVRLPIKGRLLGPAQGLLCATNSVRSVLPYPACAPLCDACFFNSAMWEAKPISMVGRRFPCFFCDSLTSSRHVWISCCQSRPSIFLAAWLRARIRIVRVGVGRMGPPPNWPLNFLIPRWSSLLLSTFGAPANDCRNALFYFWSSFDASFRSLDERKGPLAWHVVNEFAVTRRNFRIAVHGFTLTSRLE